jgi:hypothetical protein
LSSRRNVVPTAVDAAVICTELTILASREAARPAREAIAHRG